MTGKFVRIYRNRNKNADRMERKYQNLQIQLHILLYFKLKCNQSPSSLLDKLEKPATNGNEAKKIPSIIIGANDSINRPHQALPTQTKYLNLDLPYKTTSLLA